MIKKAPIFYKLPDDPALLAALGKVVIRHSQLHDALRMMFKTLSGLELVIARDATDSDMTATLRDRIIKHARRQFRESPEFAKIQALMTRAKRLSAQRNEHLHGLWGELVEGDGGFGEIMVQGRGHEWKTPPTIKDLEQLAADIYSLVDELHWERLNGWIAEAVK